MATYREAGVNISAGDEASSRAYAAAMTTFASRKNRIGEPLHLPGGFAGLLDFGTHYLVMGCDTVGTKIQIAAQTGNFSGLGKDLVAMVADDAVCVGAETIAITNTIDTKKVDTVQIEKMMNSLAQICREQKIVIPGGEIAESPDTVVHTIWDATALGIVEKEKYISGEKVKKGDIILGLRESGLRCNGFSLARHICNQKNIAYSDLFSSENTWGDALLTPSVVYHDAVLHLLGRYGEAPKVRVHGIAHITGGGIAGNLKRILRGKHLGASLPDIWDPPEIAIRLQELGNVEDREAYKTWNMGNGMMLVLPSGDAEETIRLLDEKNVEARIVGEIISGDTITHVNYGKERKEKNLKFPVSDPKN